MRIILAVALVFGMTCTASADPTLPETTLWLVDHLPAAAVSASAQGMSWNVTARYSTSDCVLTIATNTTVELFDGPKHMLYHLEFRPATAHSFREDEQTDKNRVVHGLASIDFSEISPSGVVIKAARGNSDSYVGPPINVSPKLLAFTFEDKALAERVERAMLHAIDLCGGKPEAF